MYILTSRRDREEDGWLGYIGLECYRLDKAPFQDLSHSVFHRGKIILTLQAVSGEVELPDFGGGLTRRLSRQMVGCKPRRWIVEEWR